MPAAGTRVYNVVPDRLDLRDRLYQPPVGMRPKASLPHPGKGLPVLAQGETSACTGFALATVIHRLLNGSGTLKPVSPFMLYAMARRYDEFPGSTQDTGSSLRGALKGWYKHGACKDALWMTTRTDLVPDPDPDPAKDWRREAALRPLGAYYRVDTRSITDMQIALNETGTLYASALAHELWNCPEGQDATFGLKVIPPGKGNPSDGHAFALMGYTPEGFIVQNSWGEVWGSKGLALLTYEDWLDNAMDCWVTQLGVVTRQHEDVRQASSLRTTAKHRISLSSESRLRNREIDPFIVDMENNGRLSGSGEFMTTQADLEALVGIHIPEARKQWGLREDEPIDIAIYAHGGLTGEAGAARTAANWIPALYENKIFPIFFMWETDWWSTLKNRMEDLWRGQPMPAGSFKENMKRFWDERLERFFSAPGSLLWSEMKQNAQAISASNKSGAAELYRAFESANLTRERVRLHLIGHSAGAIVHCHLAQRMEQDGWQFGTIAFMAPAATTELFESTLLPLIKARKVGQYHQFHLSDSAERQDGTCSALLGYSRSLLYLVSQSFEGQRKAPILGMETTFSSLVAPMLGEGAFGATTAPGTESRSSTHGGFDDDEATRDSIIKLIRQQAGRPTAAAGKKGRGMELKGARS